MRWNRLARGRDILLARIGCRCKYSFVEFAILFLNLRALIGGELLQFVDIVVDRIGEIAELERKQVCIRKADDCGSRDLRECPAIDKLGIRKMREPVEVVIDGMIDTSA